MTIEEIQAHSEARASISETLHNPWMLHAIAALEQSIGGEDVPDSADALASVRMLAREKGERRMLDKLKELILPLIPPAEEEYADFGTGLSPEEVKAALEAT